METKLIYKFKLGEQVTRLKDVFDQDSKRLYGRISKIYSDYKSKFGPYPELYEVIWSDGKIEKGFLPNGLDKV